MNLLKSIPIIGLLLLGNLVFAQTSAFKCMLQLKNYKGEGAYIVVSLLDTKGKYVKTLGVMGDDDEWYNTLKEWHKFQKIKKEQLDAITGASVSPGNRSVKIFKIESKLINKGYKIRFESAVEDQPYYSQDIEIPLNTTDLTKKYEGKGYIRFVKLSPA